MRDVMDLFIQLAHDPITALWVVDYVYPAARIHRENKEKASRWERQIRQIAEMAAANPHKHVPVEEKPAEESAAEPVAKPSPKGKKRNAPVVGMEHALRNSQSAK